MLVGKAFPPPSILSCRGAHSNKAQHARAVQVDVYGYRNSVDLIQLYQRSCRFTSMSIRPSDRLSRVVTFCLARQFEAPTTQFDIAEAAKSTHAFETSCRRSGPVLFFQPATAGGSREWLRVLMLSQSIEPF